MYSHNDDNEDVIKSFVIVSARRDNKRYGRHDCSPPNLWLLHGPGKHDLQDLKHLLDLLNLDLKHLLGLDLKHLLDLDLKHLLDLGKHDLQDLKLLRFQRR